MESRKDSTRRYEVERSACHAERPGFRINELQISPIQKIPWHYHTIIQDTFYVLQGRLCVSLRDPEEEVRLSPGETYTVRPRRPGQSWPTGPRLLVCPEAGRCAPPSGPAPKWAGSRNR